jgi:hypothetical protein
MARPFISAGLVASVVAGVVALGASPASAGEGPPPQPFEYVQCLTTYLSTPLNSPSVTVCSPIWPA